MPQSDHHITLSLDESQSRPSPCKSSPTSFSSSSDDKTPQGCDNISRPSYDSSVDSRSSVRIPTSNASSHTLVTLDDAKIQSLSFARLLFAHAGAALTLFLATTDATIVSTILPTITGRFAASQTQYTWVCVTYMLTQTAFQPLYGKVSDLIGRKTVLFGSIFIFALGSALCGSAQSMTWLISSRAIAGIGGGGIVSLVWTITAEIVQPQHQAKWSQALSVTWACSAVAGPLLGGIFSETGGLLSWRWAFYINLPICASALVILWLSLQNVHIGQSKDVSWTSFGETFDFLGLVFFMGGSSSIIIGLNLAANFGWSSASTIVPLVLGLAVLIVGGFYEVRTKRDALFPPAIFKDSTIVITLIIVFLHNFAFNAGTFYLALFFQAINGLSPLQAGVLMLTYSLTSAVASMPTAWFIGWWQSHCSDTRAQKCAISAGLAIATLGFGLLILMNEDTPRVLQSVYAAIAGVGLGMLFHAPYQVFTRALRRKDAASGTSAFFLVRFTGASLGLAIAGAVVQTRLAGTLPSNVDASNILQAIWTISSPSLKAEAVHALTLSIRIIWAVCCPCLGVALLISVFTRNLPMEVLGADGEAEKSAGPSMSGDASALAA